MKYYSEKRDFIRMRVETEITLECDGINYDAVCIDLSSTGMQIETSGSVPLSEGQSIRVLIPSAHSKLSSLQAETIIRRLETLDDGRQALGLEITSMQ
ncbi:PilZ domain-containing protein [Pseudomonas sp. C27(2019)]|uniref:PilZ domain-containing protein n=1 Tax=Pseudomonas sp. C27(2019) TaxID=2604941 RepID=UPI0012482664|nr:PilZ domain-containing protein [Pseudomonas sp. C27(2019)]QEY58774.1 PilZ domain-containing protein [Pseudomonas sp. C27(2019)]